MQHSSGPHVEDGSMLKQALITILLFLFVVAIFFGKKNHAEEARNSIECVGNICTALIYAEESEPMYRDPSYAVNGTPNTTFSGYIEQGVASYTRFADPALINVGANESIGSLQLVVDRAVLIFNVSALPRNISITDVKLRIFISTIGDNDNNNVNTSMLFGTNATYTDDTPGNTLFFNDAGNKTPYNLSKILVTGQYNINITTAGQDINNSVFSGGLFSIGLASFGDVGGGGAPTNLSGKQTLRFQPRTAAAINSMPMLNITFTLQPACSYSGGNWNVSCVDRCVQTQNIDMQGKNISFTGAGTFTLKAANITNIGTLTASGNAATPVNQQCRVFGIQGGTYFFK